MFVSTPELVERLEMVALRKRRDALLRAASLPGNPYGVALLELDGFIACRVTSLPTLHWYNSIAGLGDANLHRLDDALAFYTETRVVPTLSLWSTRLTPVVGAALFDRSFAIRGVGTTLVKEPDGAPSEPADGVRVRELAPDEESDAFDRVLIAGYGFEDPIQLALFLLENEAPEVRRYLATVDGEPAAAGSLAIYDDVAFLGGASTLPRFRARGAQTSLIRRRLCDAARSSRYVVVTTAFASKSQRNLEREGFAISQVKTTWAPRRVIA